MLRDDLSITVFTYNRADSLSRTLQQLFDSPFAGCAITVLDNASTDRTPAVCAEWAERFERLRVVRHRVNVGLGPNYLRAVELTETRYAWIMSDDETYDFSDCGDVVAAIEEGQVDLISLGSPGQQPWERGLRTTTQALAARGQRYFFVFTFVAGVIFRTEQFDDVCVARGYRNSDDLYPQWEHVRQCLAQDRQVLVSRREISRRTHRPLVETVGSNLHWLTTWVRSTRWIDDRALRARTVWEAAGSRPEWIRLLALGIAAQRRDDPAALPGRLWDLLRWMNAEQRLILLALTPIGLVPGSVHRTLRRVNHRRLGVTPLRADGADEAREYDALRL